MSQDRAEGQRSEFSRMSECELDVWVSQQGHRFESGVQERVHGTTAVLRGLLLTFQATEWPEVTGSARGLRQERRKGFSFQPEVRPHLEPKQQLR